MKKSIHSYFLLITAFFLATGAVAQTGGLAPDQNPNYMIARDKYITIADSVIAFHGTTIQDTYKAIDFLVDRREAREQRRLFRQNLRMERVRYGGYYYDDYNTPYYYNNFPYYNGYRNYRYGRGWNGNNFYRNSLPIALTIGSLGWWWCR
jgi:hypothetical protein